MKRVFIPAAVVFALDQVTKAVASAGAAANQGVIGNVGALAGIIPARGMPLLVLAVLALAGFTVIGARLVHSGRAHPVILGLLAGGAAGNVVDRIVLGHVQDFIWTPWLVINVADVFLATGAVAFAIYAVRTAPLPNNA